MPDIIPTPEDFGEVLSTSSAAVGLFLKEVADFIFSISDCH